MRLFLPIAIFLVAASSCFAGARDGLQAEWVSHKYVETPFPESWKSPKFPATQRNLKAFLDYRYKSSSIKDIVAEFGIPDRYLVRKLPPKAGEYNWLIYKLPNGYAAGFYVLTPPSDFFAAGVVVDPKGKPLNLIK